MLLRMGGKKQEKEISCRGKYIYIFLVFIWQGKKKIGLLKDLRHFSIPSIYKFLLFLFFLVENPS